MSDDCMWDSLAPQRDIPCPAQLSHVSWGVHVGAVAHPSEWRSYFVTALSALPFTPKLIKVNQHFFLL